MCVFISGFSVLFWWSVCLWWCHIILSPDDTALNYCSFAVSLKSGHVSPTNLFFFKIVSVWDPLHFLWLYFTHNLFSLTHFWPYWVLIAACRLSLAWVSGGAVELRRSGFSLQRLLSLWTTGSRALRLQELCFPSSRAQAQWLWCLGSVISWDLPGGGNPCLQNWQADALPLGTTREAAIWILESTCHF